MKPYMFFIFPFIFISWRGILIKHLNDECLAQLGEHFLDVEGVMGSSPLALTGKPQQCGFFVSFLTGDNSVE